MSGKGNLPARVAEVQGVPSWNSIHELKKWFIPALFSRESCCCQAMRLAVMFNYSLFLTVLDYFDIILPYCVCEKASNGRMA
jgi:hypothetical protein